MRRPVPYTPDIDEDDDDYGVTRSELLLMTKASLIDFAEEHDIPLSLSQKRLPRTQLHDYLSGEYFEDEDEDEENTPTRLEILEYSRDRIYAVAEQFEVRITNAHRALSMSKLRAYLADQLHADEETVGQIEFGKRDNRAVEDITTSEMLKSFLMQPDADKHLDTVMRNFPALRILKETSERLSPMLAAACHLLEQHGIELPETVNQWWCVKRDAEMNRINEKADALRRVIDKADAAKLELQKLLGPSKDNGRYRRIKLPGPDR